MSEQFTAYSWKIKFDFTVHSKLLKTRQYYVTDREHTPKIYIMRLQLTAFSYNSSIMVQLTAH